MAAASLRRSPFGKKDWDQLKRAGVSRSEALRQVRLLSHPPAPSVLDRPCSVGDGIVRLSKSDTARLLRLYDHSRDAGRLSKFVPAAGAASRLFQALQACRGRGGGVLKRDIEGRKDPASQAVLAFMRGLQRFAFYPELQAVLAKDGLDLEALLRRGRWGDILSAFLGPGGLDAASRPKGLFPVHAYADGARTPLDEHLAESVEDLRDGTGLCRVHFAVAPEHLDQFMSAASRSAAGLERRSGCRFHVTFSVQKRSTDTLALDARGRPFRKADGTLLLRPGGHGALLENLGAFDGDVVFLRNIDNVAHEGFPGESSFWRTAMCGLLLDLQAGIFQRLSMLHSRPDDQRALSEAFEFAEERLSLLPPQGMDKASHAARRRFLLKKLDRPLRVCGVVPNAGEPGGGPFWVEDGAGRRSLQIIEGAQVDARSPLQRGIFSAAGHFNPVDMVLGVRDWRDRPFDLLRRADPASAFVARKSHEGRPLKALERPGLWNGGMADWNTVFVEVPGATFHPVKTLNDLLRPDHQT